MDQKADRRARSRRHHNALWAALLRGLFVIGPDGYKLEGVYQQPVTASPRQAGNRARLARWYRTKIGGIMGYVA